MKKAYGNDSISSLKGAQRVRKRPAVIFGSDGIEGCQHCVFEILSNSIDEAREGFGNRINLTYFEDNSIQIEDYGRGIPVDYNNNEKKFNWELLFCELYAGGKYSNSKGENYEYSLGLNGLGLCATQYSSEFMDVTVCRDGFEYSLHFEKGENVGGLLKKACAKKATGTKIKWKPDLDVFTDIYISKEYLQDMMKRQSIVNAKIHFELFIENESGVEKTEFYYKNGIVDHVNEILDSNQLTSTVTWHQEKTARDREDKPSYKVKVNVAFAFSNKISLLEYYHNSSWLEHGGAPQRAMRTAFVSQIDSYLKKNGKYSKNESKITYTDVEDCLVIVISSFSNVTSYENQTKKAITNKGIQDVIAAMLNHNLEIYFTENRMDAEKISSQILINKRSREDAEKARVHLKKKLTANMDITNRVAKFVDCRSKDKTKRELFIVEGDSALGACKQARDPEFQAIIPVRGKILNCLKSDYGKIFKNEIIVDLIKVLGCGVQIKSKSNKQFSSFDIKQFRWSKIILCTDADVDGFQIRTLLLTMLYILTPELINKGKIFIVESPLYEINTKNRTYFAYSEREKLEFMAKIKEESCIVQRSKGLGENEPDMMNLTTMNPLSRRTIKVVPEDIEKTQEIFNILLGDNLAGRKEYIVNHGELYMDNLDVS
ncbi:MAG: DNA topoisomerase [Oscillospiraceae bacterium]|nr:DNA topoisomerase [Oscillospiraceae bacterium]